MLRFRHLLCVLALGLLPALQDASAQRPAAAHRVSSTPIIAVADFTGADTKLGRFLADTLLTDLAQSDRLRPQERAAIQRAFHDQRLPSNSPLSPQQVRNLTRKAGADRLIVGSYLERDGQILMNARLLDARTGLVVPGGAMNVSGDRHDLLGVMHRLAQQLHRRVTGRALSLGEAPVVAHEEPVATLAAIPANDDLAPLRKTGMIPAQARANAPLMERDLITLVKHVAQHITPQTQNAITPTRATIPATRIRVLTAFVKLTVGAADIATFQTALPDPMPPDTAQIPSWGLPYAAAAVSQGWLDTGQPFHARDNATWGFVAAILVKILPPEGAGPADHTPPAETVADDHAEQGPFTGLVIDARDLTLQRAIGPRILDADGHVLYPDPKHVPDVDYLEDHGMAGYFDSLENAQRAGNHPLVVRAIAVQGPGHDDLVVSNEAAEQIREAERRSHFLARWRVAILATEH